MKTLGRNNPCDCGSGKKYKRCCGKIQLAVPTTSAGHKKNTPSSQLELKQLKQQAEALQQKGHFRQAVKTYRTILDRQPKELSSLIELGKVLTHLGDIASEELLSAIKYLKQAAKIEKNSLSIQLLLLNALSKNFMMNAVVTQIESLTTKIKQHEEVQFLYGSALNRLHRHKQALTVLKKLHLSQPENQQFIVVLARVYINLKQQDKARAIMEKVAEGMPSEDTLDDNERLDLAALWYELAKLRESQGDYAPAFYAAETAGAILQPLPQFSVATYDGMLPLIESYQHWIDQDGFDRNLNIELEPSPSNRQLVFFVGFPRSGTTLTEQILAAHSQVTTSEEHPHLSAALNPLFNRYQTGHTALLDMVNNDDIQHVRDSYWAHVHNEVDLNSRIFVDKLPLNLSMIAWIQVIFPDAKLIVAIRDPRDVCLSCFFQHFSPNPSMNQLLTWQSTVTLYQSVMNLWLAAKTKLNMSWMETRYEDMVSDYESQTKRIFDFVGAQWEPEILNYREKLSGKVLSTPSHEAIQQPIYSNAQQRWKNHPQQILIAKPFLKKFITEWGYPD